MIDIYLHGGLRDLGGAAPLALDVKTSAEALHALSVLVPGFEAAIRQNTYRIAIDGTPLVLDHMHMSFGQAKTMHIIPDANGAWIITTVLFVGLLFAVDKIIKMAEIDPDSGEAADKKQSYLFNGGVNSIEQGGGVPLIFGQTRAGSTVISAGIKSEIIATSSSSNVNNQIDYSFSLGKGGGGEQHIPVEAENSLQTTSTAYIVDLLGEGEIDGLVNGGESLFLDGTPLQNSDGTYNFEGVSIAMQNGAPDQAALDGFDDIESERNIGLEVLKATPITQSISNPDASAARVTIKFPRLSETNSKGDVNPTKVEFRIEHQNADGVWGSVFRPIINDKCTAPAEISWRIPLAGDAPHNIRVTRITADSDSDKLHNEIHWSRLTEIVEARQSYPTSALVGVLADAETYGGNISTREYDVKGLIIDVPANYDPETRTYNGVWDGTFKQSYSNNPAWCIYALFSHKRFGLGEAFSEDALSLAKWQFYKVAQFCDAMVPDGDGGTEPRFRFNGVIAKRDDAFKLISNLLAVIKARLYFAEGAPMIVQDSASDPVALISNANVVDGEFGYTDLPLKERYSAVSVTFNDPDDGYKRGVELVVDDDLVEKYGLKQTDRGALLCTSRAQAHRLGKMMLLEQEYESDIVVFRAGGDQAYLRPGDVIKIADENIAGDRFGGRVKTYDADKAQLTLDAVPQVNIAGWQIDVVMSDGTLAQATITAQSAPNVIMLDAPFSQTPLAGAMFVLSGDVSPRLWRVISIAETSKLEYEIKAQSVLADKWDVVENNVNITLANYSITHAGALAAPTEIALEEYLYQDRDQVRSGLTLSVPTSPDARARYVEFQLTKPDEENYSPLAYQRAPTADIRDMRVGTYSARARYVDLAGIARSPWTEIIGYQFLGKTAKPSSPENFTVHIRDKTAILLSIDPIADLDRDDYSFYYGPTFAEAVQLARLKATSYLWQNIEAGDHIFWVVAHDTSDAINGGSEPVSTSLSIHPPVMVDVTTRFTDTSIAFTMRAEAGSFHIDTFIIRDDVREIARARTSPYHLPIDWQGNKSLRIVACDIAGNESAAHQCDIVITPPVMQKLTSEVVDNNVLLRYAAETGSLALSHYELYKGDELETAEKYENKAGSSSFTTLFEKVAGTYTYWMIPVDMAGNKGDALSTMAIVSQPPDYILFTQISAFDTGWAGDKSGCVVTPHGHLLLPVKADETVQDWINNGYATVQDEIDAGYDYWMQPGGTHARYEEVIDYGTTLSQAIISATATPLEIDGETNAHLQLAYSADGSAWVNAAVNQEQMSAHDFRYAKITLDYNAQDGDDLLLLRDLQIKLDKKVLSDAGRGQAQKDDATPGTYVLFNVDFIDVQQINVQADTNDLPIDQARKVQSVVDFLDEPYPDGFHVMFFDDAGNRLTLPFGWGATGF